MKYNFAILCLLIIGIAVYGCASISDTGEVRYDEDIEEVREASVDALQQLGMEIRSITEDGITSDYIIIGERQVINSRVDSEAAGNPELVRLEVIIRKLDDSNVSVNAETPAAANYASTTSKDLAQQFYSSLEENNLEPHEE